MLNYILHHSGRKVRKVSDWSEAAKRARAAEAAKHHADAAAEQQRRRDAQASQRKLTPRMVERKAAIDVATRDLERFRNSGKPFGDALELLTATNEHVVFGAERDGSDVVVVFMDGRGIMMWVGSNSTYAYHNSPAPAPYSTTVATAARYYVDHNPNHPEHPIVEWLWAQLDALAARFN